MIKSTYLPANLLWVHFQPQVPKETLHSFIDYRICPKKTAVAFLITEDVLEVST